MKLRFLILEGGKPPEWVATARADYAAKINPFVPFEIKLLKSPNADRDSADVKRKLEAELILRELDDKDLLVLFDERGKLSKTSEEFSVALSRVLESGKSNIFLCIGGPYGFADEVRRRAQSQWSLSPLTMNHWIAGLMALEQVYRGMTILRGIPYHNR
jgi:23S rRNA (pseudouridine1915-N3)-methyltransferase